MALSGSRLNTARYTSALADIQTQFPVNASLTVGEKALINAAQAKLAHAIADSEGTDVVAEITGHATVATTDTGTVTSGAGSGGAVVATGTGTVS